jgi:hypothetical protein
MNCPETSASDTSQIQNNADCSTESFTYPSAYDPCYAELYTTQPTVALEYPEGFGQEYQFDSSSTIPNARPDLYRLSVVSTPCGQFEQFATGFPFDPTTTHGFDTEAICISPYSFSSDETLLHGFNSPELSPSFLEGMSPTEASEKRGPEPQPRKRGRLRLNHASPDSSPTSYGSSKSQRTSRIPHNQVERKYRQGLNSELERLRRAVPTLPQCSRERAVGQPQLSKAMVLVGAIEHIKTIERERDALIVENKRLRVMMVV